MWVGALHPDTYRPCKEEKVDKIMPVSAFSVSIIHPVWLGAPQLQLVWENQCLLMQKLFFKIVMNCKKSSLVKQHVAVGCKAETTAEGMGIAGQCSWRNYHHHQGFTFQVAQWHLRLWGLNWPAKRWAVKDVFEGLMQMEFGGHPCLPRSGKDSCSPGKPKLSEEQ